MESVFVVQHAYDKESGEEEVKFIGVFSTQEAVDRTLAVHRLLPGFRDHPDGFHVDRYRIDEPEWKTGFVTEHS